MENKYKSLIFTTNSKQKWENSNNHKSSKSLIRNKIKTKRSKKSNKKHAKKLTKSSITKIKTPKTKSSHKDDSIYLKT